MLYVDGMGWMIIIGRRSSKSTFGANKSFHLVAAAIHAWLDDKDNENEDDNYNDMDCGGGHDLVAM